MPRKDKLPDSALWQWFEATVRSVLARYGYQYILTPIVEPTALFVRGLGEVTDIVEKEMYSCRDEMNGDQLTLRPEATAGIVRAMIEHNALYNGPLRLWTMGAMFRHERPQKGRYRQFHQLDVEALGFAGPDVDAEQILMVRRLWRELGLVEGQHVRLEINSLGQPAERARTAPRWWRTSKPTPSQLDDDARRRLHSNPLRILDTKNPAMQALVEGAPKLMDFLGADIAGALRCACARCSTPPGWPTASTRAWCAAWTTTTSPSSSGSPTISARRARCAAAAATTACSSSSAASRRRPSASGWASSGCCC